jgi:glutamate racemase
MNKIGFLDSGVGGLTVLEAYLDKLSHQQNFAKGNETTQIIYFADLANLPYGGKSTQELQQILINNLEWFSGKADCLVLACNTSSALLNNQLRERFPELQIFSLIQTVQEKIKNQYANLEKVAVFSTLASHSLGAYEQCLKSALPQALVQSIPCPKLVPLIETNIHYGEDILNDSCEEALNEYVAQLNFEPQALIFGCSHYPLLKKTFQKLLPKTLCLDPGECLAEELSNNITIHKELDFQVFSSAEAILMQSKLDSLKNILRCANYFRDKVQLAQTASESVKA